MVEIKFPKSRGAKGRAAGIAALEDQLRRVTKGQRNKDKRVKIQAVWDTGDGHGRIMDIGSKNGYHASDVLGDVRRDFGGDTAAWIASQSGERYEDLDIKNAPLFAFTLVIFDAIRSKEERKAMDVRGTRRRKWRR